MSSRWCRSSDERKGFEFHRLGDLMKGEEHCITEVFEYASIRYVMVVLSARRVQFQAERMEAS